MANKKMIPCRVCGNLFEPCATCQAHNDIFRWRNFACSRECATKYINDTIAYRESLKTHNKRKMDKKVDTASLNKVNDITEKSTSVKKNYTKKELTEYVKKNEIK